MYVQLNERAVNPWLGKYLNNRVVAAVMDRWTHSLSGDTLVFLKCKRRRPRGCASSSRLPPKAKTWLAAERRRLTPSENHGFIRKDCDFPGEKENSYAAPIEGLDSRHGWSIRAWAGGLGARARWANPAGTGSGRRDARPAQSSQRTARPLRIRGSAWPRSSRRYVRRPTTRRSRCEIRTDRMRSTTVSPGGLTPRAAPWRHSPASGSRE